MLITSMPKDLRMNTYKMAMIDTYQMVMIDTYNMVILK
jgi:hypothetical protein